MTTLDYIVIVIYFIGLLAVSFIVGRRIKSSEDMFIAGRNSSWWLSGISSYMTLFSAGTFVIWAGVAYKSGIVAVVISMSLGLASLFVAKWISGYWRRLSIKSPGEYLEVRFGRGCLQFYTIAGMLGKVVTSAVALYAISIMLYTLSNGKLNLFLIILALGLITAIYTMAGGFLAVLMTDVVQFGVLFVMIVLMIPLSFHEVGGVSTFVEKASAIPGYFSGTSETFTLFWLVLWVLLNAAMIGGDWPYVQRYVSVPTVKDAKKSTYLIGILFLLTPIIFYLPAMVYRVLVPGPGMDVDAVAMNAIGEGAYMNMSSKVLMTGMVGMMMAAMLSATLSLISGAINVFANVFTLEIWGGMKKNRNASEAKRIRVGRIFTLILGLAITGFAMLIPFAGGAEKVIVTILTVVICPLYIPSIWGLFSRRLTAKHLITAMAVTWIIGFGAKFLVPAEILNPSLVESLCGFIVPVVLLACMEISSAKKGSSCEGYEKLSAMVDPNSEIEPGPEMQKAVKSFSFMACNFFAITVVAIALLLLALLAVHDPKTMAVKGIVVKFVIGIFILIAAYVSYRIIDHRKNR
ncbi:MAG: sodium:solute symporter [Alistipes sp.]|nr:sodium:solute symporter [Candidatus Alistipes equi]